MLDLLDAGRSVAHIARDLEIPNQTISAWRRHEQVDKGLIAGPTHTEVAQLVAACRRLRCRRLLRRPVELTAAKGGGAPLETRRGDLS